MTFSTCKHNTVKSILLCAANSVITFVSDAYGGRVSGIEILIDWTFLDKFDPHDMIQAEWSFNTFDKSAAHLTHLYVPPGRRGQIQMSTSAVYKTKRSETLGILLEQVIKRLKSFQVFSTQLAVSMLPSFDKIISVCAALCNLKSPIYSDWIIQDSSYADTFTVNIIDVDYMAMQMQMH